MDTITFIVAIKAIIDWIPDTLQIFMSEPAIYFVAVAMVSAITGVTRKFVPIKRR